MNSRLITLSVVLLSLSLLGAASVSASQHGDHPASDYQLEATTSPTLLPTIPATMSPDQKRLATLIGQGNTANSGAKYPQALSLYTQALALARKIGDHTSEGLLLTDIGGVAYAQGQYDKALDSYNQALTVQKALPDKAPQAITLDAIGNAYYRQAKYPSALTAYTQALDLWKTVNDQDSEAWTLNYIAGVDVQQGDYAPAIDAASQALDLHRTVKNRSGEAADQYVIGNANYSSGVYDKALDAYMQTLTIYQEISDKVGQASVLNAIASTYLGQGQPDKALDAYSQALTLYKDLKDFANQAGTLTRIAQVYHTLGKIEEGLDVLSQALKIYVTQKDIAGQGYVLTTIGDFYWVETKYAEALDFETRGLALSRQAKDRANEALALYFIAGVYQGEGLYAQSLDQYKLAQDAYQAIGDQLSVTFVKIQSAYSYQRQGQYDQALQLWTEALPIIQKARIPLREGPIETAIGSVYNDEGQYDKALDPLTKGLTIDRQNKYRREEGGTLIELCRMYLGLGQYDMAVDNCTQGLIAEKDVNSQGPEISALDYRGLTYEKLGQQDNAIADYRSATVLIENVINAASLDSAISGLLAQRKFTLAYQRLTVLLAQKGDMVSALSYTEAVRSVLIRTELTSGTINFRAGADQKLIAQEATSRDAVLTAQLKLDGLQTDPDSSADDLQAAQSKLQTAQDSYQKLLDTMQLQGGFLARQVSRKGASAADIQAALPDDTTMIIYSVGDPNSIALLVSKQQITSVSLPASFAQIDDQVNSFMTDRRANVDALGKLYDMLFAPLSGEITTKHLMIVPDATLAYIPFAALSLQSDHYLIDDYAISMLPSATTLVLLKDRVAEGKATSAGLVMAQPNAPGLPQLANVRTEATNIAQILGVKPVLDASSQDLRNKSTGSSVLTLSTHVQLDTARPLFSAIYLKAGPNNDGRFEVHSIYELNLARGTDLVVLSGCNTASGGNGEDFGVLTRAFFGAGASRVVASLWSVDDESTTALMTEFMSQRAKLDNDADALRAAMLATREKYPEPYFWASFDLTGLVQ